MNLGSPAFVTTTMIYKMLIEIKKEIKVLKERDLQHSIEEVSLYRASKLLKEASSTLFDKAEAKEIPARKIKSNKSLKGYTYKFRLFDIYKYQLEKQKDHLLDDTEFDYVESAEAIAQRIFGGNNGK